jgi:hypothetical protein
MEKETEKTHEQLYQTYTEFDVRLSSNSEMKRISGQVEKESYNGEITTLCYE